MLTVLVCWLAFSLLILLCGFVLYLVEERTGQDPLERIWNLGERTPPHELAARSQLYPVHGRQVLGTTKNPPRRMQRPGG